MGIIIKVLLYRKENVIWMLGNFSRLLKKAKAIPLSLKNQQMTLRRMFTIQYALFQIEMVDISY